jgi:guanylate kinase
MNGPLIILSGPSGSGKSTVVARLLERTVLPLRLSVSATTRSARPGEVDGVQYHFWTRSQFEAAIEAGEFLEWANVYGNYYGTLKSEVGPVRDRGKGVLLEIDVQGAAAVRQKCPDSVSVFLRACSMEEYEKRLRKRHTESEEAIQRRLAAARLELAHESEYDYTVLNDDVETAVAQLEAIIQRQFGGTTHAG